jgi:hypothetical protein
LVLVDLNKTLIDRTAAFRQWAAGFTAALRFSVADVDRGYN